MEPLVTIAIPDLARPQALNATLTALARHTSEPHELVLLAEAAAGEETIADQKHPVLRRLLVPAPFGLPAALNRLLPLCNTPYLLLLESGAIVTAGWLSRLLGPLSNSGIGLSGPSTNMAWNEQQVLPRAGGLDWSAEQIELCAAELATHYGDQYRPLDTLHSLGDFCYLFKRSVAEKLGGFDEAYGAGPCWEIDFNTRAARVGFQAVWVPGAYVHREPLPSAQVQTIRRLFAANKQLYQDRFCGLRLREEKSDYRPHCRGEACKHFAPPDLIQITLTANQPGEAVEVSGRSNVDVEAENLLPCRKGPTEGSLLGNNHNDMPAAIPFPKSGQGRRRSHLHRRIDQVDTKENDSTLTQGQNQVVSSASDTFPLVSCILPTHNRRDFITQSLRYFTRQDYPNLELIIVDDGTDRVADLIPENAGIRYVPLSKPTPIGTKRNLACELAQGEIIAHWDDDDWYAPHRLRHQVEPLLKGTADVTGLETSCFFDLTTWQAWTCTPALHQRLFVHDVHGGTLVYRRWVWERLAKYPGISVAEDALFLREACRSGARLQKLPHARSFVYLRHDQNAWQFPLGHYLDPSGWQLDVPEAFIPAEDRIFYAGLSPRADSPIPSTDRAGEDAEPLVSCIMPTCDRRAYVPQAIHYFLRQNYPNRELLVLDDGSDRVADLMPPDPRIRYIGLERQVILGAKRNLACEMARGDIIVHWDDDDWMASYRLQLQVTVLMEQKADLCGANRQLYYDPLRDRAWLYSYPPSRRPWLAGNTLCYHKAFWAHNPFPEVAVGEDTRFVWNSQASNAAVVPDHTSYVGIIHAANTSPKVVSGSYWRPNPVEEIHCLLGSDLAFYHPL